MITFSFLKLLLLHISIIALISCSDNTSAPPDDNTQTYPGYNLVWSDEFNETSLDQTKWNYETGTGVNGDFGTGQIDRATNRIENVSIVNGIIGADGSCLSITTRKEVYIDRNYTSGKKEIPKIKRGSSIIFKMFASHKDLIASAASPAPRNIPFIRKRSITIMLELIATFV